MVELTRGKDADWKKTMSLFLQELEKAPVLADGAMGSYLFGRTGRLSETNHVYEAFSLDMPELVHEVHLAYLRAGACCVKTNTFGANRAHLKEVGEQDRLAAINRAGVATARGARDLFREQAGHDHYRHILGSVGPPPQDLQSASPLEETYLEQLEILIEEGVDALLLETFNSLDQLLGLIRLIKRHFPTSPPLIAQMALGRSGYDGSWSFEPVDYVLEASDLGADVVGINCCAPWDASAFLETVTDSPGFSKGKPHLSAMPNAGGFQRIGNRFMSQVTPEYMGQLARRFVEKGVQLIGGCCEVHPPHIREMHNYLHGYAASRRTSSVTARPELEPAGREEKGENGQFSRKLFAGKFAVSVEILPARGTAPAVMSRKVDFISRLAAQGLADALDITDGSRGISLMHPGDFVAVVRDRLSWTGAGGDALELIPHFTGRDLNVMGIQSRLIGYHARHIHNVLFITGDPPKMSPTYPRSTAVFDLDSATMVRYTHNNLNAGIDFGGRPLGRNCDPRTHFTIGSGFEPEALDTTREVEKLRRKMDAGVDYIMTQPVFHPAPLERLNEFRDEVPILIGVMILTSLDQARRVGEVPGVVIPESVYTRLGQYEKPADQAKLAVEIAIEQIRLVHRDGWAGLYLMSPANPEPVLKVLEAGLDR